MIIDIEKREKEKYKKRWSGNYRSASAIPFAEYLMENFILKGKCLEIGSGDGTTLRLLRRCGVDVLGSDITLEGCKNVENVEEFPAWDIPYENNHFYYSFSTDVLEHIPTELIIKTTREICRVTRAATIHQIATFPMSDDHLTVRPIEWWKELFRKYNVVSVLTERSI